MNEKVKLTKAQAQTIGYFKESDDWTDSSLVEAHAYNPNRWEDSASPINGMPLDTLIRALYTPEDVTIEQTVEERLIDAFDQTDFIEIPWEDTKINVQDAYRQGMKKALNIIGMKVKGINA